MSQRQYRVALVTPLAWDVPSAINFHVAELARELLRLGHLPTVIVSSDDSYELRRMRALCRRRCRAALNLLSEWIASAGQDSEPEGAALGPNPDPMLLPTPRTGPIEPGEGIPVLPLGRSFHLRINGSVANVGLPVDLRSRLERLLVGAGFDVVHVHEPIAPSLSFTAVRESRSPVIATFHMSPVGMAGLELERGLLERFYRRLDARIVTSQAGGRALGERFSGGFEVIPPGTRLGSKEAARSPLVEEGTLLYVYRGDDRRGLRAFLRAIADERPPGLNRLVVAVHRPSALEWPPCSAPRRLAVPVTWHEFEDMTALEPLYRQAAAVVLPYLGGEWLQQTGLEAVAQGYAVAAPDFPLSADILEEAQGRLFSPRSERSLARALAALLAPEPAEGDAAASAGSKLGASRTAHSLEAVTRRILELYEKALHRGKEEGEGRAYPIKTVKYSRAGVRDDGLIYADLHIHTNHSKDSTSSVAEVLEAAFEVGLGAVAIADHDTIAGGLEARELAGEDLDVIVASEIKTSVGEVIGLFLEEEVPGGLSFEETLGLIKEQGGLVYIPHPFDGLRSTPSYESMVDNLYRIDVVETYNARVALSSFNLNAERFASKYNLVAGAGSDAHVLPGIGTAMLRMQPFNGPEEFMTALREADIVTHRKNLLYLQSLKFLQTTLDHVLPTGADTGR